MNVKVTIELPKRILEFVEEEMRSGGYSSLSELFEDHFRDRMLSKHDATSSQEQIDVVHSMKDELLRRMELPDDQWIPMDENDKMFERLEARLRAKYGAGE